MSESLIEYRNPVLYELQHRSRLKMRLRAIHESLRHWGPDIERISMALYDQKTDTLKTFVYSSRDESPLQHYESSLKLAPALREVFERRQARVVNDLDVYAEGTGEHTQKIKSGGYLSSYTFPVVVGGEFQGFIFFNAQRRDVFTDDLLPILDVFGHLISSLVMGEITAVRTLLGAMKSANDMVHYRDPETGNHLERMARFSRVIARELSKNGVHHFDDEYIENVFLFAPMHDVGKIGIPDDVLLKPARLTESEFDIMRTHTNKGREICDHIIENFGLDHYEDMDVLRNIAEFHHETMDGGGYPKGLSGDEIPIEARIVAVADVFDALTSERPYKKAWTNERAIEFMRTIAISKLDVDCVETLVANLEEIEQIQRQFAEQP